MTILETLQYSNKQLESIYEAGEAAAMSRWLLESLGGIRYQDIIKHPGRQVPDTVVEQIRQRLPRLLAHEPLQYVLEEAWFCGLKFHVDKRVLIPRPETEELVEWIISDYRFPAQECTIADIGTGSGCIPIALKRRLGKAQASGFDISAEALQVARQNALQLGVDVRFEQLDFLRENDRKRLGTFDILVSNPPYIPYYDKATMAANVTAFEPGIALFVPDEDPLIFYAAMAGFGKTHLDPGGAIYLELYEHLAQAIASLFAREGYSTELKKDMQGKERMLRARKAG